MRARLTDEAHCAEIICALGYDVEQESTQALETMCTNTSATLVYRVSPRVNVACMMVAFKMHDASMRRDGASKTPSRAR